eukprot:SAG11_NODE_1738_length_4341_cov_3.274806_3_plen_73_part_00
MLSDPTRHSLFFGEPVVEPKTGAIYLIHNRPYNATSPTLKPPAVNVGMMLRSSTDVSRAQCVLFESCLHSLC